MKRSKHSGWDTKDGPADQTSISNGQRFSTGVYMFPNRIEDVWVGSGE